MPRPEVVNSLRLLVVFLALCRCVTNPFYVALLYLNILMLEADITLRVMYNVLLSSLAMVFTYARGNNVNSNTETLYGRSCK